MEKRRFAVVGSGPVAREIGRCMVLAGHRATAVISRSDARAREASAFIGAERASATFDAIPGDTELLLLATADAAIVDTARAIGARARGRTLVHFAGSLAADAMRLPETEGARVVSVHPLRHFSLDSVSPETFAGTFCAIDGDPDAVEVLTTIMREIGGDPFPVESAKKPLYHATVLLPLTFSVVLWAKALELLGAAGVPDDAAGRLVARLTDHARERLRTLSPKQALHGPIAHGDVPVVRRFVESITTHRPSDASLFAELSLATIALARSSGSIAPHDAATLEALFRALLQPSRPDATTR